MSFLFNEAEVFAEEHEKEAVTAVAAHKRHGKHEYTLDRIPGDVPVEKIEHQLEDRDLVCPQYGRELTEIGKEVVNKLKIIPARVIVEQHIYYSYACRHCNREDIKTPVVHAPKENHLLHKHFSYVFFMAAQAELSKSEVLAALLPENAPLEFRSSAPKYAEENAG